MYSISVVEAMTRIGCFYHGKEFSQETGMTSGLLSTIALFTIGILPFLDGIHYG
ncbi:hypothetical protein P280DRAFT_473829 [Massarina eburnea CBS 473.64]|uniref:Uncharacterized protein n=1 Tax=Massarina eburnea CBS 473.64 TaxID=1395130 RepID=A0A6A6RJG5_9PLEO|nr:hypothetical protein P280DRAFT_473829 [Massarina eburnea CBS 473.64]